MSTNTIQALCTREKTYRYPNLNRWAFKPREANTPENSAIAFFQGLAFRFLRWTGAMSHPISETTKVQTYVINSDRLIERILRSADEVFKQGFQPARLLIGSEDFARLMDMQEIGGYLNFDARIGYGREICGLKVEVIPWMRGMVALP